MAEHDPPGLQPVPVAHFELDQADDYSQYLLYSKAEILAVLRTLLQKGALITVHFDQGKSFFLTSMISLKPDSTEFVIDVGSDEEMNAKALKAGKLILTAVVDKVKIQFSLDRLGTTESQGRPAFIGSVPDKLLRLQRREFFRLSTPIANPVRLCTMIGNTAHGSLAIDLPLLDISGGGVGLMVTLDQAKLLEKGDTLDNCKIVLPSEGLLVATLCVRNMFDVTTRGGSRYVRVGCEFLDLPAARGTVVQRYITRIERERKARLSGLT